MSMQESLMVQLVEIAGIHITSLAAGPSEDESPLLKALEESRREGMLGGIVGLTDDCAFIPTSESQVMLTFDILDVLPSLTPETLRDFDDVAEFSLLLESPVVLGEFELSQSQLTVALPHGAHWYRFRVLMRGPSGIFPSRNELAVFAAPFERIDPVRSKPSSSFALAWIGFATGPGDKGSGRDHLEDDRIIGLSNGIPYTVGQTKQWEADPAARVRWNAFVAESEVLLRDLPLQERRDFIKSVAGRSFGADYDIALEAVLRRLDSYWADKEGRPTRFE